MTTQGEGAQSAYVIAVKDFTSLAEFIAAKKKSSFKVPRHFAKTLERAISVRKKHGTAAAPRVASENSKKGHSYFVGILERVTEVLAPLMPDNMTMPQNRSADPRVEEFSNSFAAWNVEEPSQKFLDAPDIVIPERPPPDFEAEMLDDFYEMTLASSMLQYDLMLIRQVIKNLWVGYKYGYYDTIAVSLVTNTAIDFARALENDLSASMEKYGGFKAPSLKDSQWFITSISACIAAFPDESRSEDELIRGFRVVLKTGKIQFWNVLAVQLFLDDHHLLREDAVRPWDEMREAAEEIETTRSTSFANIQSTAVFGNKLLEKTWKDMETFIELQGETIFKGRSPETPDQYLSRFFITHGISASSFTKDARQQFKPSKAGIKPLAMQAPLALIFLDRFARNSFRHEFTPEELKRIMEKTILWSHDDFEVKGMRPWEVAFGLKLSRPSRSQARCQAKDMNKTKGLQRLTVPELLRKMFNALEGEMFEMTFNYFRMHMQCWKVLQSIAKDSHKVLSSMNCFPMIDNAARLPYVAGMVFLSTMGNSNLFVAKMAPTKNPPGCAPILFVDTANAIEAFIDNDEGAVVTGDPDEEEEDTDDEDDDETEAPAELPLNPNPIWRSSYEIYYASQRARYFAQFSPIEKLAKAGAIKSDEHSEKFNRLVNALEKLGQ
ncbi:hypothetical protein IWZ03DRAFT_430260 [Phyllosticta citriasiana]|uniref:DUF6604 domain-containing protein n=1 Tax=Phyllosticta citriasiana TaxID=595635 RepID=A0ABR1L2W1_9PEZI